MVSTKRLVTASAIVWLVSYIFAKTRKVLRHRDSALQRQQMTIWEGEGGNLPPQQSTPARTPLH